MFSGGTEMEHWFKMGQWFYGHWASYGKIMSTFKKTGQNSYVQLAKQFYFKKNSGLLAATLPQKK